MFKFHIFAAMKKLFFIFIPIIIIDLVFDGEQIIKVPFLLKHFYEHHQVEKIHFSDFLILHYFNHSHQNQSEEHNKLPFKDHQNCTHIHFYTDKFQKISIHSFTLKNQSFLITDSRFIISNFLHSVWHPPKNV